MGLSFDEGFMAPSFHCAIARLNEGGLQYLFAGARANVHLAWLYPVDLK